MLAQRTRLGACTRYRNFMPNCPELSPTSKTVSTFLSLIKSIVFGLLSVFMMSIPRSCKTWARRGMRNADKPSKLAGVASLFDTFNQLLDYAVIY